RSADDFPRGEHLAWKIAEVAADAVAVPADTESMVLNRVIDNAAVSAASVIRRPVATARAQALAHPAGARLDGPTLPRKLAVPPYSRPAGARRRRARGAKVFGVEGDYSPEWAAWANGVAVRELDFH